MSVYLESSKRGKVDSDEVENFYYKVYETNYHHFIAPNLVGCGHKNRHLIS